MHARNKRATSIEVAFLFLFAAPFALYHVDHAMAINTSVNMP